MRCPKCGLINVPSAVRCDCGYDFSSGQMEASYLASSNQLKITQSNRDWTGSFWRMPLLSVGSIWIVAVVIFDLWNGAQILSENPRLRGEGMLLLFSVPVVHGVAAWQLIRRRWLLAFICFLLASPIEFFFAQANRSGDLRVPISTLAQIFFFGVCALGTRSGLKSKEAKSGKLGNLRFGSIFLIGLCLLALSGTSLVITWAGPLGGHMVWGNRMLASSEVLEQIEGTSGTTASQGLDQLTMSLRADVERDRSGRIRLSIPAALMAITSVVLIIWGLFGMSQRSQPITQHQA